MFNVRSLTQFYVRQVTYVIRVFCKTYVYQNVRETYVSRSNAWVVICKQKAFQGMVKCMFLIPLDPCV